MVKQPPIITTDRWGARPAKEPPVFTSRPHEIIFHHTAGHHPEISHPKDESRQEAIAYARAIQNFHMESNGWNDSGHNFLACRNGLILVGRHMSLPAIRQDRMVVSAHCPGHNEQPGIEHEHEGDERMTTGQMNASVWLHAWIISRCRMRRQRSDRVVSELALVSEDRLVAACHPLPAVYASSSELRSSWSASVPLTVRPVLLWSAP